MEGLACPLITLNAMAATVCLCVLFTLGSECKEAMRMFIIEGYLALVAITMIFLAVERLVALASACVNIRSACSVKERDGFYGFISKAVNGNFAIKVGDRTLFCSAVPSNETQDAATTTAVKEELGSGVSSLSDSPTFEPDAKGVNEDALSAATTM